MILRKPFDKIEWNFMLVILKIQSFCQSSWNGFGKCITTMSFFFFIEWILIWFFKPTRGMWQRDPFSHYLFVIETLLRMLLIKRIETRRCRRHHFDWGKWNKIEAKRERRNLDGGCDSKSNNWTCHFQVLFAVEKQRMTNISHFCWNLVEQKIVEEHWEKIEEK